MRNILKSTLNGGNIILVTNSRAVSIVRYAAGIISWTKMELEELDQRTRKLMKMYGAHHPIFRVNPHFTVALMSRNSFLEAGAKSDI